MKYAAYKEYKTSNSAWLPIIPATWQQIRGRFVMSVNPASVRLRDLNDADEVSFVPMEAVGENGGLNLERTKPLDEVGSGYTEFEDGDVVIAKITPCFENGKSALASGLKNGVAFGTTELHVLRAGKRLDKQFLFHLTTSHTFRMLGESEMYGAGGQKRVPPEFAKDFRIPLPPLDEQQTIARFLDAKTAQIDALVAQKRQLIDKLKEKRSALIARTVTRGLPPDAAQAAGLEPNPEMKDSRVDWLGAVPLHWDVVRVKFVAKVESGHTPSRSEPSY
jgi:type I restriction enzyme S subunit